MNPAYPDLIFNGIHVCLSIQLIILGVFNIFSKSRRDSMLGIFILIFGTTFFYNLYWPDYNHSLFYNILLGGQKSMFYAPLVYLYIALVLKSNNTFRFVASHLALPLVFDVVYLFTKFVYVDFFRQNLMEVVLLTAALKMVLAIFYMIKSVSLFKQIKLSLLSSVFKRYQWFIWVFLTYDIVTNFYGFGSIVFFPEGIPFETYTALSKFVLKPLSIIVSASILLFTILENERIKRWIFGSKIYTGYDLVSESDDIKEFIAHYFDKQKVYTEEGFDLIKTLRSAKIDEKRFRLYIKKEHDKTAHDFINDLRIEEFKRMLLDDANIKYSLTGLAKQAGFSSRSTFYRNFREREGKTPKEYMEQMAMK